jgi:hypothetical protein
MELHACFAYFLLEPVEGSKIKFRRKKLKETAIVPNLLYLQNREKNGIVGRNDYLLLITKFVYKIYIPFQWRALFPVGSKFYSF